MNREDYIKLIEEIEPIIATKITEVWTELVEKHTVENTIDGGASVAIMEGLQNAIISSLIMILVTEASALAATGKESREKAAFYLVGLAMTQLTEGVSQFLGGQIKWPDMKIAHYN